MAVKQTGQKVYRTMQGKPVDMDLLRKRYELNEASNIIYEEAGENVNVIFISAIYTFTITLFSSVFIQFLCTYLIYIRIFLFL